MSALFFIVSNDVNNLVLYQKIADDKIEIAATLRTIEITKV